MPSGPSHSRTSSASSARHAFSAFEECSASFSATADGLDDMDDAYERLVASGASRFATVVRTNRVRSSWHLEGPRTLDEFLGARDFASSRGQELTVTVLVRSDCVLPRGSGAIRRGRQARRRTPPGDRGRRRPVHRTRAFGAGSLPRTRRREIWRQQSASSSRCSRPQPANGEDTRWCSHATSRTCAASRLVQRSVSASTSIHAT